jgi:hypothetical protein
MRIMKILFFFAIILILISQESQVLYAANDNKQCPDTIIIKTASTNSNYIRDFMPWVVALLLGVSTLFLSNRQIKASKESIDKQIKTSKEIAQIELNKSVKSLNRQQWINSLRDSVSEYIALLETFNAEFQNAKKLNKLEIFLTEQSYALDIRKLGVKIELMLNPNEEKSKIFLKNFMELSVLIFNNCQKDAGPFDNDKYLLNKYQIFDILKSILKEEWERVKKGN